MTNIKYYVEPVKRNRHLVQLDSNIGVYLIHDVDGRLYVGSGTLFGENARLHSHYKYNQKLLTTLQASDIKQEFSYEILCYVKDVDVTLDDSKFAILSLSKYQANRKTIFGAERYWQEYYDVLSDKGRNNELCRGLGRCREYRKSSLDLLKTSTSFGMSKMSKEAKRLMKDKERKTKAEYTSEQKAQYVANQSKASSRAVIINGKRYERIIDAINELQINSVLMQKRLDSSNWPEYVRTSPKKIVKTKKSQKAS